MAHRYPGKPLQGRRIQVQSDTLPFAHLPCELEPQSHLDVQWHGYTPDLGPWLRAQKYSPLLPLSDRHNIWPQATLIHHVKLFQFSHSVVSNSLRPHGLQHARLPCTSSTPEACSNSCPLSPAINAYSAARSVPVSRLRSTCHSVDQHLSAS